MALRAPDNARVAMNTFRKLIPGSGTTFTTTPQSTRPPPFTLARAPANERSHEPRSTSAQDTKRERVSQWTAGVRSTSSISSPDSEAIFDQTHASAADTVSVGGTSSEVARPAGPRYSEPQCHPYRGLSNHRLSQYTTEYMQRMGRSQLRTLLTPMTCILDAYWLISSHHPTRRPI